MNTNSGKLRQKLKFNKFPFGVYLLLVAVIVVFFAATQGTISPAHLMNIVRQSAPLGVAAMGQTIVLLVGGIDLSVGATMSMVNLVAASVMGGSDAQILPALLIWHGAVSAGRPAQRLYHCDLQDAAVSGDDGHVHDYRRRLLHLYEGCQGSIARAFALSPKDGSALCRLRRSSGWSSGWCSPLCCTIRRMAIGCISRAAIRMRPDFPGFKSKEIVISAYVLCSLLAGIGGLLLSAYIGTASTGVGADYTLNSIASSVIGGTSFLGGIGSLEGTFPGVLITNILQSLMTIIGISEAGKFITQGIVIAVMVAINQRKRR